MKINSGINMHIMTTCKGNGLNSGYLIFFSFYFQYRYLYYITK